MQEFKTSLTKANPALQRKIARKGYNTIQYNTMQCNAMQCNAIQYMQYNTIQHNAMQYNTIQYLLFKRDKNDKHALTKNS